MTEYCVINHETTLLTSEKRFFGNCLYIVKVAILYLLNYSWRKKSCKSAISDMMKLSTHECRRLNNIGMKKTVLLLIALVVLATSATAQSNEVVVENTNEGWKLMVDGEPIMINGMNWDYFPRGTNFNYSLWNQSPEFIQQALDYEMALLEKYGREYNTCLHRNPQTMDYLYL